MVVLSLGCSLLLHLLYTGCMVQDLPEGRTEEVVNDKDEDCKPYIFRKAGCDTERVYVVRSKKKKKSGEKFTKGLLTLPIRCFCGDGGMCLIRTSFCLLESVQLVLWGAAVLLSLKEGAPEGEGLTNCDFSHSKFGRASSSVDILLDFIQM